MTPRLLVTRPSEDVPQVVEALREQGIRGLQVHAANSAGVLSREVMAGLPEATAVRPGLALYGVQPAEGAAMVREAIDMILALWESDPPYHHHCPHIHIDRATTK